MKMRSDTCRAGLLITLLLVGCHSAPPRDDLYPAFYLSRTRLPQEMRKSLEHHRATVLATPKDSTVLLEYARSVSKLADQEVNQWFAAEISSERVSPRTIHFQGESRMMQSCRHSLALFHEAELNGASTVWQDQVKIAWFSILTGNEGRAELILADLAIDPRIPDDAMTSLRELLDCLPHIPGTR